MAEARWLVALFTLVCASMGFGQETTEGRLLRFPDVSRDEDVFSHGGDLWLVAKTARARRQSRRSATGTGDRGDHEGGQGKPAEAPSLSARIARVPAGQQELTFPCCCRKD